eukprot:6278051-Prymnesium_polylepis.1
MCPDHIAHGQHRAAMRGRKELDVDAALERGPARTVGDRAGPVHVVGAGSECWREGRAETPASSEHSSGLAGHPAPRQTDRRTYQTDRRT